MALAAVLAEEKGSVAVVAALPPYAEGRVGLPLVLGWVLTGTGATGDVTLPLVAATASN